MQRLEVSGVVRPIYGSLGIKRLMHSTFSLPLALKYILCTYLCPSAPVCSDLSALWYFYTKMSPALAICLTYPRSSFDHFNNIWCITYWEAVRYVLYLPSCSPCVPSTSVTLSQIAFYLTVDYICYSFNREHISLICDKSVTTQNQWFFRRSF